MNTLRIGIVFIMVTLGAFMVYRVNKGITELMEKKAIQLEKIYSLGY